MQDSPIAKQINWGQILIIRWFYKSIVKLGTD